MITNLPRAAAIPTRSALPYPRVETRHHARAELFRDRLRAVCAAVVCDDHSPRIPRRSMVSRAFLTQVPSVRLSFKQGITTESSSVASVSAGDTSRPGNRLLSCLN